MEVLTPGQKLLAEYLQSVEMPLAQGMLIVGMLWDEEATLEMLKYIAETRETDPRKLYDAACEIEAKYKTTNNF